MATRSYKRDKNGRFAGGGGGAVTTTYGKAGGFAKGNSFGGARAGGNARQTAVSKRSKAARIGYAAKGVARATGKQAVRTGAGAIGTGLAAYGLNRAIGGARRSGRGFSDLGNNGLRKNASTTISNVKWMRSEGKGVGEPLTKSIRLIGGDLSTRSGRRAYRSGGFGAGG